MHHAGPALVIAGAGSGKTRTVVQRIAYLINEHEVYPNQILAVTFTNKAAGELRERVEDLIGATARDIWVNTFHSACLKILRTYGEKVGLQSGFAIYDDTDQLDVLKEILALQGTKEINPRVLRSLIDRAKSNLWTPENLEVTGETTLGRIVSGVPIDFLVEVFKRYEIRLRQVNAVDFNDILGRTVELFDDHPDILDQVQKRAVFIHVDEYQDTNRAQYRLTRQLAEGYRNLMVVGDPDQSIYAFRGADITNILEFRRDYADAAVFQLELNYRSVAHVLKVANAIIVPNKSRLEKKLLPVKENGDRVRLYRATDHRTEADFVARQVELLVAEKDYNFNDFAVLYRTNAQSRVLEEALRRGSIPTRIIGGVGFYERLEVKDVLSYARASINPFDDIAWKRILNRPKRGIGKTSEDKLVTWAANQQIHLIDALRQAESILRGTPAVQHIANFIELMDDLSEEASSLPASMFMKAVIDQSGYIQALKAEGSFEAEGRLENLEELLNAVAEWESEEGGPISDFLDEAALMASVDERAVKAANNELPEEAVTLMTLHNAKGLEFPVVILVGIEENLLPHRSSTNSLQDIEEERRLLYVGITRAQEDLFLVNCESRMSFGRTEYARPSRFLEDIPKEALVEIDVLGREIHASSNQNMITNYKDATSSTKTVTSGIAGSPYKGGERVKHPRFGTGTVVGVKGQGTQVEVAVQFETVGLKHLLVRYARLQIT